MLTRLARGLKSFMLVALVTLALDFAVTSVFHERIDRVIERETSYRVMHRVYHHTLARNRAVTGRWGPRAYPLFTNSLGFKDERVRDVALASAGKRLLFIGDSFTEGIGATYGESFVGRIGQALAGSNTEVLNAAVASYAPSIYYRKIKYLLETEGLKFDEAIVFIDISDIDDDAFAYAFDADDNVVDGPKRQRAFKKRLRRMLEDHFTIVRLYFVLDDHRRGAAAGDIPAGQVQTTALDNRRALWTFDDAAYQEYGALGVAKTQEYMDRLAALLRPRGIPLTVVVYPWPDQIAHNDLHSRQVTVWRDWSARHGIQFIDLFPAFMDGRDTATILREDFIPADVHWNEAGHRRVAEAFLARYRGTPRP